MMSSVKWLYTGSTLLALYVGLSSTFITNSYLMLSQWLVILLIMNIWAIIVKRSIHYATWFAVCGWFVALIIQQLTVLYIQLQKGAGGYYLFRHDLHQTLIGILLIIPAIPTGYFCSWITKKACTNCKSMPTIP
jgi:hypothetical protein